MYTMSNQSKISQFFNLLIFQFSLGIVYSPQPCIFSFFERFVFSIIADIMIIPFDWPWKISFFLVILLSKCRLFYSVNVYCKMSQHMCCYNQTQPSALSICNFFPMKFIWIVHLMNVQICNEFLLVFFFSGCYHYCEFSCYVMFYSDVQLLGTQYLLRLPEIIKVN